MKLQANKLSNRGYGDYVNEYTIEGGVELLDHYAGIALNGLIVSGRLGMGTRDSIANEAFELAERMLEARGEYL